MADLTQRLQRLPPGHPSSPYQADGTRKPTPPKLRALELPLPDDEPGPEGHPEHPDRATHDTDAPCPQPYAAETSASTPDAPDEPDVHPDGLKPNYWTEVPRFLRMWADHVRNWPAERMTATVDRSRDPDGSWRGDGNQYLDPEQHARATDAIDGVRRAEPPITGHLREAERQSAYGGQLVGLDYRLKGEERLKEKVAERARANPDVTPEDVTREIADAIRYTFQFEPGNYADGYRDVRQRLEEHECVMFYSKNSWQEAEYKGINTRWVTPGGQRFEVQFHTAESFHAKQEVTHDAYERLRNRLTDYDEQQELRAFQREVSSWVGTPDGAADIPDVRKKGY
jgi:hypothetical protein